LTASATDINGHTGNSTISTVTVNNIQPTLAFNLSANSGVSVATGNPSSTTVNVFHALVQKDSATANSRSSALGGVAIIGYRQNGILVSEFGVPASPQITSGRVYTEISTTVNTGIALSNLTSTDATVNFYFTDVTGQDWDAGSITIFSGYHLAAYLNQAPFNGPSGTPAAFQGSFTFTSNVPIGVIALRGFINERGEFLSTTVPVTPVGVSPNASVLPQFTDGAGWTTSIFLTNTSANAETGSIQFFGPGSGSQNAPVVNMTLNGVSGTTFKYSIPARSSARFDSAGLGGSLRVGSIVVTPDSYNPTSPNDFPSAVSLIQLRQSGITISQTTFIAAPAGKNFQLYMETSGVNGQAGSVQSGLVIANPFASPVVAHIDLYRLDGTSTNLPTATITVPPGGQISAFIDQFFPTMPASFKGIANVTTSSPLAVVALRGNYNERGEFLMTTTPPVDDAYPSSGTLVFPQIVSGQGFSTQVVVFGQNPGTGRVYLYSSSGTLQQNGTLQ
jgi:hypothetical protein